ncbi:uncharacterized protein G2W53_001336 [Senna tora]|uniref:Uncharacterized protein n=1 Tax=Senna tora TaxID=362788 RepID=A0A834XIH5_9FABA|nr:uncharacterized protein G2W53_001336 [Senna tora]
MAGDSKPSRYVKFHGRWKRRATRTLELKEELGHLKSETKKNHDETMKMLLEIYKSVV